VLGTAGTRLRPDTTPSSVERCSSAYVSGTHSIVLHARHTPKGEAALDIHLPVQPSPTPLAIRGGPYVCAELCCTRTWSHIPRTSYGGGNVGRALSSRKMFTQDDARRRPKEKHVIGKLRPTPHRWREPAGARPLPAREIKTPLRACFKIPNTVSDRRALLLRLPPCVVDLVLWDNQSTLPRPVGVNVKASERRDDKAGMKGWNVREESREDCIRQDEVLNRGSSTPTGVGTQPNGSVGTPHTEGLRSADEGTLSKEAHNSGSAPFSTWRGRRVEVGRGGRSSAGWAGPAHQQGRAASMGWAGAQQAGWCVLDYEICKFVVRAELQRSLSGFPRLPATCSAVVGPSPMLVERQQCCPTFSGWSP
jgi:hypothetical protein